MDFDPITKQVIDAFDVHAKKRATELLASSTDESLQVTREVSFCLGYKAGVVDLGVSLRERLGVDMDRMVTIFVAACAWRDSRESIEDERHVAPDDYERQLLAAIDAARETQP